MGRPTKENMPYFSHDTDSRNDRKLKLLVANTGLLGFGFFWAILEDIYNHSYYLPWAEEDQHLFVADFSCSFSPLRFEDVNFLLEQAFKWGVFDRDLYYQHEILTSPSVQRRYLKQSSRRVLVEMRKEFILINLHEFYQNELKSSTLSVKVIYGDGQTAEILGDYKEDPSQKSESKPAATSKDKTSEAVEDPEPELPEYDSKYDFTCTEKWDGEQPIDYSGCVDVWNKINGCNLRISNSKREDLRRVFRTYIGQECMNAMIVRAKDENMKDSKYLTQWNTLFGSKKHGNLDKWVDRGREWLDAQNLLETPQDHLKQGWLRQGEYEKVCKKAGIEFEDSMFCETKNVQGQLLYYPKFDY